MSRPHKSSIFYWDRRENVRKEEPIYSEGLLRFLYSNNPLASGLMRFISKVPLISKLAGFWQKGSWTRGNIARFVREHRIDINEFEEPLVAFNSFNDFFIRKLRAECRPLSQDPSIVIMPADGRYRFFQTIDRKTPFVVKGGSFF